MPKPERLEPRDVVIAQVLDGLSEVAEQLEQIRALAAQLVPKED